jgi:hypothetical protein
MTRLSMVSLAIIVALSPTLAGAQGVEIDHKAVGCIVVGKYPKMNACFTPAANVARSRVYFRPEGTPSWYYVEMKSDQPCFSGVLPRPGKKLVGKKIEYYVEAQDKTFNPARTAEYGPVVVNSAQECKKQVPVAPFLNNAAVAVFPALPAGFVGAGIGTAAVVGIAAAGAAAVGTAAVVASNNNNDTTTTTAPVAVVTTTTTLPPAATTTTTTVPTAGNRPPFAVLTTIPDPPSGPTPLTVTFDLCKSTDPDGNPLSFFFNFGDGAQASGSCVQTHTYVASSSGDVRKAANFEFTGSVVDPSGASASRSRTVVVQPPPPPTTTTTTTTTTTLACKAPTITITAPTGCVNPNVFSTVNVDANATDSQKVSYALQYVGPGCGYTPAPVGSKDVVGPGPTYPTSFNLGATGCYRLLATALSACSSATASAAPVTFDYSYGCSGGPLRNLSPESRPLAWASDLTVKGRLQVVLNGSSVAFPAQGRAYGMAKLESRNRVEATLVESAGGAGTWRFDLKSEGQQLESLRVISGEVVAASGTSVTFRLRGVAGERVVFEFLSE